MIFKAVSTIPPFLHLDSTSEAAWAGFEAIRGRFKGSERGGGGLEPVTRGEYSGDLDGVGFGNGGSLDFDFDVGFDDEGGDGEWALAIWSLVRKTSCGYVASDAIIFEAAEHIRMVDGGREEWLPSGSEASASSWSAPIGD